MWVALVPSKDVDGRSVNLRILEALLWNVSLSNALQVVRNSDVNVAKFDVPLVQRLELSQLGPLGDKPFAIVAIWVHERDDPDVIVITHDHIVER